MRMGVKGLVGGSSRDCGLCSCVRMVLDQVIANEILPNFMACCARWSVICVSWCEFSDRHRLTD